MKIKALATVVVGVFTLCLVGCEQRVETTPADGTTVTKQIKETTTVPSATTPTKTETTTTTPNQ